MKITRRALTAAQVTHLVGTEAEDRAKRQVRENLLAAFDIWEKGVLRGREKDSAVVMAWYQDLLDLKASAYSNVPEVIKKHLKA